MKTSKTLIVATISLLSLPAMAGYGTVSEGWGFVQDDWQVVCDNTRTCRAAGYASEALIDTPASILLTALPKVALPKVQIQFISEVPLDELKPVELWLNNKNYGLLQPNKEDNLLYDLSAKQTQALLDHARIATKIAIRAGDNHWQISDKGMSAVLLKLDDEQGRVGTPIALVSKNNPNRQRPKAALPKPIIQKAFAYSAKDNKTLAPSKLAYFQKNIDKWIDINAEQLIGSKDVMGDCELINPKTETYQRMSEYGSTMLDWDFIPVDDSYMLATHTCWLGAYNFSNGYWLIDNAKPSKPMLITTAGNDYFDGEISATHKDRGIGDCWNRTAWIWNGKTFAKSEESSTGMCRGFAGGAWDLPTYVSQVIRNDAKAQ
ncbi:MAG: DUF1176 domain-containing protein [Pseudomonadales bacterium]|uniref:DUF1176 domain-containing protein n=1 Tax=Psychrobacter sp. APC 3279 TaxID=3035189 RepID=UPI0025B4FBAF|nr:DUF1176 domain-containing protein [Psychrobacter sp. APC 3279]MDN3441869.1 DUF1176 domain-containing protein [Psychrobacter sp. APC 3279]